jgi:hypothetical protein
MMLVDFAVGAEIESHRARSANGIRRLAEEFSPQGQAMTHAANNGQAGERVVFVTSSGVVPQPTAAINSVLAQTLLDPNRLKRVLIARAQIFTCIAARQDDGWRN